MLAALKLALLGSVLGVATFATEPAPAHLPEPWPQRTVDVETGILWQIGSLTPLAYRLMPTQLSWRSRALFGWELANGSRILVRHRLTLIATLFDQGPESHYVGFSGSPSIEWWNPAGTSSLYFGSGGGFGWLDSRGVTGGQGQDFTLNWFIRAGFEQVLAKNRRLSAGIMYQHLSNAGATDPNPGIDALGFTLGYGWSF